MNDAFAERLVALGSSSNDSDWLDVRRRAGRGRARVAAPAALVAAAVAAAGALAAGGGWIFSTHDRAITARTDVTVGSRVWHVSYTADPAHRGRFCARASSSATNRETCLATGRGPRRSGPPFGALRLTVPGGQIWAGATVAFARRITITDTNGAVHGAKAVTAPKGTKTPFRYWAIAITGSAGKTITAYNARGRKLTAPLG